MQGNVASIETMGLVDGPGVRVVVFMQGCPLRCAYCHNPEMWNANGNATKMSAEELVEKIKKYRSYFGREGGVTISGGEPLLQSEFVARVFKLCKAEGINTCLDTSGFGENFDEVLNFCDLVILDVKELNKNRYKQLTGQEMTKFERFLDACQKKVVKLWLRQVIVPNFNDNEKSVKKLKNFAKKLKNVEKIELLPYHNMAERKYERLKIDYRLKGVPPMDKEKLSELEKILKE